MNSAGKVRVLFFHVYSDNFFSDKEDEYEEQVHATVSFENGWFTFHEATVKVPKYQAVAKVLVSPKRTVMKAHRMVCVDSEEERQRQSFVWKNTFQKTSTVVLTALGSQ